MLKIALLTAADETSCLVCFKTAVRGVAVSNTVNIRSKVRCGVHYILYIVIVLIEKLLLCISVPQPPLLNYRVDCKRKPDDDRRVHFHRQYFINSTRTIVGCMSRWPCRSFCHRRCKQTLNMRHTFRACGSFTVRFTCHVPQSISSTFLTQRIYLLHPHTLSTFVLFDGYTCLWNRTTTRHRATWST